ncbi:MAG TPA: MtrB/PioB family outer membrane beta-barrel protein, partial [Myxococcota bacterium]|nr:MtrB/PioB family outer membrane beta-barrel protein [Myxococcota bacterium]
MRRAAVALLGIALDAACLPAAADSSDTARVGDLQYGNGLDPRGWTPMLDPSGPDEMSWLHPGMLRTPSGVLYAYPPELPAERLLAKDWLVSGRLELGYLFDGGDEHAQLFTQYTDWDDSFALPLFELDLHQPDLGHYVELRGSFVTDDNQFYRLRAGRYGRYKLSAFYRDIPHIVTTRAYPFWNGFGSENLTLPGGLIVGGSDPAAIAAAAADAQRRTVRVDRSRSGVTLEGNLTERWIGYASLTNEERNGTRLWGGPMFFNTYFPDNGGILETVRPIDFSTWDTSAGVRFANEAWRFSAQYTGSFFRNHKDRLNFQSPFQLSTVVPGVDPAGQIGKGQFSLEPDNDYHNVHVDLSRNTFWDGELSASGAWATMRQNDDLAAPVTCTGRGGIDLGPGADYSYACADWNTPASLSRLSAQARIDTLLLNAKAIFRPLPTFSWHVSGRYYRENNRTDYVAFNPLTHQYGYISENGSQGSVVPGEVGIFDPNNPLYASYFVRVRNTPYEYQDTIVELEGDWQLSMKSTLSATYSYDLYQPEHRERDRVDEHRIKLGWVSRDLGDATLRLSYEFATRGGDEYNYAPYTRYFSAALPGFVTPPGGLLAYTVESMRKYDLSDRIEHKFRAIVIYPWREATTVSGTIYGNYDDYNGQFGRQDQKATGFVLQTDFQPAPETTANAYFGLEYALLELSNVADNEAAASSNPAFGGPTYPFANAWNTRDKQRSYYAGATVTHDFGRWRPDAGYGFTLTQGRTRYDMATIGALPSLAQPFAGTIGGA